MTAIEQRFRRNFILACIVHGTLVGGIIVFEGLISNARSNVPAEVELITPADILGDLPKGPEMGRGMGRGNSAPPSSESAAEEQPAPKAVVAPPQVKDPNEILIPRKTTSSKTKTATATTKKIVTKTTTAVPSPKKTTSTSPTVTANAIRQRFTHALQTAGNGTDGLPGGDGRAPGGGIGESKYGRLGSPEGAPDGIAGGIGKGSPFWSYYLQVKDQMYEAWQTPGQVASFDKKLVTTVMLRVARDGRILDVRLQNSSGNKLMDDSVLAAARSVPRLEPLPDGLGGEAADITVNFRLEG